MGRKVLMWLTAVFFLTQAVLEGAEGPRLASRIPEDAVGAVFVKDLPELAKGKAWMRSLSEVFVGEVAVALLDIPGKKEIPAFILIGKVNREKLGGFLEVRLKPILQRNLGKVEFHLSEGIGEIVVNDSPMAFYAVKDGLLAFSLTEEVVSDFMSRPIPAEKSLQANPLFGKVLARTFDDSRSVLFVNVGRILEIFGGKIPEPTQAILEALGILDIEAIGASEKVVDGVKLGSLSLITSGKPRGLLALLGQAAAPPTSTRYVSGDYSFFTRLHFSSFSEVWEHLIEVMKGIPREEEERNVIDEFPAGFREATGLDFKEDVLDSLGGEVAVAVAVPERLRIPDGVALLEVKDREKVEKVIAKILPVPVEKTEEYKGVAIQTVRLGPITAAYAFVERYLVMGTDVSVVKSAIDVKANGGSLTENPAFGSAVGQLGDAGHLVYLDMGSALPIYLSAVSRAMTGYGWQARSEPPRWEVMGKLLLCPLLTDSIVALGISGDQESVTLRGYSTISGTYNWMAGSSIMAGMLLPALSRATESARRDVCISNLYQLARAEHMYAEEHDGKFSEKLSDLYPDFASSLNVFTCPSARGPTITRKEDIDSLTSYVLRKGLTKASPSDEVLIYEKLENHFGRGGSAAFVDGHVKWLSASALEVMMEKDEAGRGKAEL